MKVSLRWLKRHADIDINLNLLHDVLVNCSLEVENIHIVNPTVVVKIHKVERREGLNVQICQTTIDNELLRKTLNYDENYIQVLTGAEGVKEGMTTVLAPLNTTVNGITIQPRTIRNHESFGMFLSYSEIDSNSNDHSLIDLSNDSSKSLGDLFSYDDIVIEVKGPTNRSDLMNMRGIAREVISYLNYNFKTNYSLKNLQEFNQQTFDSNIKIESEIPMSFGKIKNIKVKEEILNLMKGIDKLSINPLQTLNDFVLLDVGTPIHLYDTKDMKEVKVCIKRENENMIVEINNTKAAIGGIRGLLGFNEETKDVLVEAGIFPKEVITNRSTEAAKIFQLGIDNEFPTIYYVYTLCEGEFGSICYGNVSFIEEKRKIFLSNDLFYKMTNIAMSMDEICKILNCLHIETNVIKKKRSDNINDDFGVECLLPSWRKDLEIPEDIVEEVLRMYGFDKLILPLQMKNIKDNLEYNDQEYEISKVLANEGFFEIYSIPFVKEGIVKILNPINHEKPYLRSNLKENLVDNAQNHIGKNYFDCRFFEIGKIYPSEQTVLAMLVCGKRFNDWRLKTGRENDFYYLKEVLQKLNMKNYSIEKIPYNNSHNLVKNAFYVEIPLTEEKFNMNLDFMNKLHYKNITISCENWNDIVQHIKTKYRLFDIYKKDEKEFYSITIFDQNENNVDEQINLLTSMFQKN
jgi:phenylalanyl-tRNA synthetase beta chain